MKPLRVGYFCIIPTLWLKKPVITGYFASIINYEYDAWGNVVSIGGNADIANLNPIRYRGYYYDTETGFYYLNSRYYDPEICRFVNADDSNILWEDQGHLNEHMPRMP